MTALQKMIFAVRAKPGLSRAQALTHLRTRHAPLLLAADTNRRRVKTYIQNYAVDCDCVPAQTLDRDWIIESWRDPAVVLPEPPIAADAILVREDEARFPDRTTLMAIDVVEQPVCLTDSEVPLTTMPFKVFTYFRKKASSQQAFLEAWSRGSRALSDHPAFCAQVTSYVRNVAVPGVGMETDATAAARAAAEPAYAGIDVWRFRSLDAIARLFDDAGFREMLTGFEEDVVAAGSVFRLATLENRIFDDVLSM